MNSNVAAQTLGAVTLRDILTDNGNSNFGLAADKIAALTKLDPPAQTFVTDDFLARLV